MEIYKSTNLIITQKNNMFIQEWQNVDLTLDDFQQELKIFLSFYEQARPKSVLWLQENFKLQIPNSLYEWIENDIVKRQYETGMTNLGFTVSADMLSHLSVMASFEKIESVIQPNFFIDKNNAVNFLHKEVEKKSRLEYEVKKLGEIAKIDIKLDFELLPKVISSLNEVEKEQRFINQNLNKIRSLTPREMEIFKLIVNGYSSKEIGIKLFIETSTVNEHRKKIIKKLNIKKPIDWFLIAKAFNFLY